MKKFILIILAIILLCMTSCERSEYAMERDAKREAVYNKGYKAGYSDGKFEGIEAAKENFKFTAMQISWDADNEFGIDPEWAIMILGNYADGEPISREEVDKAIWTLHQYYYDMQEAINDLDSYID